MSTKDKVARYLQERKRMVDTQTIATYFLLSVSTVSKALSRLENEGKAIRQKHGNFTFWKWNHQTSVAVPQTTYQVQPSEPTAVRRPPPQDPNELPPHSWI